MCPNSFCWRRKCIPCGTHTHTQFFVFLSVFSIRTIQMVDDFIWLDTKLSVFQFIVQKTHSPNVQHTDCTSTRRTEHFNSVYKRFYSYMCVTIATVNVQINSLLLCAWLLCFNRFLMPNDRTVQRDSYIWLHRYQLSRCSVENFFLFRPYKPALHLFQMSFWWWA